MYFFSSGKITRIYCLIGINPSISKKQPKEWRGHFCAAESISKQLDHRELISSGFLRRIFLKGTYMCLVLGPCPFLFAVIAQGYVILIQLVMFSFSSLFTLSLLIAQPLR
jgi:hypothetical protein